MRAVPYCILILLFAACDGGGLDPVQTGFRIGTDALDFGKALVGEKVTRELEIVATGRGSLTVQIEAAPPFEAPASVELPGAGAVRVPITWTVGPGPVEAVLTASARDASVDARLLGRGVVPGDCQPTARCREVRFDLETERCIESVAGDGVACTPESLCLENGVCREGACVGTPRTCDDGNACTRDACSLAVGCVHTDISSSCSKPQNPCEAATCHPVDGCGTELRGDGAVCGEVDCVTANLCQSGTCKAFPTPEGFLCAPATPCQGEGHCSGGSCVRPDAGTLKPEWSIALAAAPAPADAGQDGGVRTRMGVAGGNVYFTGCGLTSQDGGCALSSFTSNGFLRFEAPLEENGVLAGIAGGTVAVLQPEAVRTFLAGTGAPLWSLPLDSLAAPVDGGVPRLGPGAVALDPDGGVFAAVQWDDGLAAPLTTLVHVTSDGGVDRADTIADAGAPALVALSASGSVYLYDPAGPLTCVQETDGGTGYVPLGEHPGAAVLSVAGERLMPGGQALVNLDGGVVTRLLPADAGEEPVGVDVLASGGTGLVLFRREGATLVRAFDRQTGASRWEAMVLPDYALGEVIGAHAVGGSPAEGVLTLTEATIDGGVRSDVQLFANGRRAMLCPIDGTPRIGGGVFAQGRLFAIVERGGAWQLEAFDLTSIPFAQDGWPTPGGTSAARRER